MNDRTLVKLRCNKEMLDIRTVSWTRKSPYSFSILRSELQQLEQRPQNRLISGDCGSFAVLQLTQGPDGVKMLEIRFTWLQEIGAGKVHGWQKSIRLPYEPLHVFVENGEDMDGAEWRHLSVPEMATPRYEFHSRKNLHEVARRPVLRRKLGRVLEQHFQWRGTEKIVIYDDSQPYSFFFEEYTPYGRGICGGIILLLLVCIGIRGVQRACKITVRHEFIVLETCCRLPKLDIVLLADLHLGCNSSMKQLQKLVDAVNRENPDLVCIAGDIFDNEYDAISSPEEPVPFCPESKAVTAYMPAGATMMSVKKSLPVLPSHRKKNVKGNTGLNSF